MSDSSSSFQVGQVLISFFVTGEPRYYRIERVTPRQLHVRRCCVISVPCKEDWASLRVVYGGHVCVPLLDRQGGPLLRASKRDGYAIVQGMNAVCYVPDTDPYDYSRAINEIARNRRREREARTAAAAAAE